MSRAGRALRAQAFADAIEGDDTVRERLLDRGFAEQAVRERTARFPVLTNENADEAIRFQSARLEELRAESTEYAEVVARIHQRVNGLRDLR